MLVEEGKANKKSTVLAIVAIVLLIITAVVVYFVFFTEPDVSSVNADVVRPAPTIQTTFPTEVLENEELRGLKLYGPSEVTVSERGRKADPFQAF